MQINSKSDINDKQNSNGQVITERNIKSFLKDRYEPSTNDNQAATRPKIKNFLLEKLYHSLWSLFISDHGYTILGLEAKRKDAEKAHPLVFV